MTVNCPDCGVAHETKRKATWGKRAKRVGGVRCRKCIFKYRGNVIRQSRQKKRTEKAAAAQRIAMENEIALQRYKELLARHPEFSEETSEPAAD